MGSNNITFDFADKLGYESPFENDTNNQQTSSYEGLIDKALLDKIVSANDQPFEFDYLYYSDDLRTPLPLIVKDNQGNEYKIKLEGALKRRIANVKTAPVYFHFDIDMVNEKIEMKIILLYADTVIEIGKSLDWAIQIVSKTINDFEIICNYLKWENHDRILAKFMHAINSAKGDRKLKFLFENAPGYVFKEIGDDKLWNYLLRLLAYDESSNKQDASSAILNILMNGFNDSEAVYNKLNNDPKLVLQLYDNMDNGNTMPFCQFLTALSLMYGSADNFDDIKRINTGGVYIINSVSREEGDPSRYIYLKNSKKMVGQASRVFESTWPVYQLRPIEIVELYDVDEETPQYMCALAVKKFAADKNKAAFLSFATDVLTIISFFTSVGILIRGAGLLMRVIAVTDIATTTVSQIIKIPTIRDFLDDSEEGRWLLANWDTINMIVNLGVMSPLIVKGIIKNGPAIIESMKSNKQFLMGEGKEILDRLEELLQKAKGQSGKLDDVEDDLLSLFRKTSEDNLGGRLLTLKEIKAFRRYLLKEYGINLKLVDKDFGLKTKLKNWNSRGIVGAFNPSKNTMYLRSTASELTVFHETAHAKLWKQLSQEEYSVLLKWQDETYVWGQIWRTKSRWTKKELLDSYKYVNGVREDAGVEKILIEEMEELKKLNDLNLL